MLEVSIGAQQGQLMANCQLYQKSVNRSELHAVPATLIAHSGGLDMVVTIGCYRRQGGEAVQNGVALARAAKALQELLQNETSRINRLSRQQCVSSVKESPRRCAAHSQSIFAP